MLEDQDREWLKTNMELASIKGAKASIDDHVKVTHEPLDKRIETIDKKAGLNLRTVLYIATGCAALGAILGALMGE